MKVAIFHNYLDNIGGAERVGLILARELKADVYSTNIDREKIKKMGFRNLSLISIGSIPTNPPFRQQLALWKFSRLQLKKKYDYYIIDGDWAMSGALHHAPTLWYVHSPIREIWDLYEYTRKNTVPWFGKPVFDLWVTYNRALNRKYVRSVGRLACNSLTTQDRVQKYLHREAVVIPPPVDTKKYYYRKHKGYWLSVSRLITHKRIEMQLKAFKKLPHEHLIIVGCYEQSFHFQKYMKFLKKIQPQNVTFLHWIDENKMHDLYAHCKGFITTSKEEDFGLTAVEAMASGKPVIAPREGGYKESVLDGKTGILIDAMNETTLAIAIKKSLPRLEEYKNACLQQARMYDTSLFIEKIKKELV